MQDKLFLPGLLKLRRLVEGGFFGRVLSVRGEFGYWVFEGDWQSAQRPSWNYRAEDGGGIVVDMFPHWEYVLHEIFGRVRTVQALATTHIPQRWDEAGKPYDATADDAAYGIFELEGGAVAQINSSWAVRVNRDELVEFQVDGTHGSAVAGLRNCRVQHRSATPKPVWNPDLPATEPFRDQWQEVPDNAEFDNGFKAQWELFLRHVALDEPWRWDLLAGARGVQLAELGLKSSAQGPPVRRPGAVAVSILLPDEAGRLRTYAPRSQSVTYASDLPLRSRVVYSAAHVVADPLRVRGRRRRRSTGTPPWPSAATCGTHGLGVAEAMDTAQRGMGLDWAARRGADPQVVGRGEGGRRADRLRRRHRPADRPAATLEEVTAAYEEQLSVVEAAGSQAILMASRALAAVAKGPDDYLEVYGHLLRQSSDPVILHWLGPMFDPALAGYWGSDDLDAATETFLQVIAAHPDKVDGVKISLLDAGPRGRPAPTAPRRGALLHRRRLPLPGADRGRRTGLQPRPARHLRPPGAPGRLGGQRARHRRRAPASAACWTRRSSCPGTCSARRRASTRRASSCSPGWPATRRTSPWWAVSSRRAPCRIWRGRTNSPTASACSPIRRLAEARMRHLLAVYGVDA